MNKEIRNYVPKQIIVRIRAVSLLDLLVNLLYLQEDVFSELLKCGDIV